VANRQNKNKISFKDKFEFETLEKEINTLETRKAELNDFLAQSDLEYSKLQAYSKELSDLGEQLDEKSFRWLELDELING
jgi:ABC transport system ATP-binding/permease protein